MDSRQAYLAAKYMSGPKADAILAKASKSTSKKRKPRSPKPSSSSAFLLQDNDAPWSGSLENNDENEQSTSLADAVVASDRSFKKRHADVDGGGWATIRAPTPPPPDEQPIIVQDEISHVAGGILGKTELTRLRGKVEEAPAADQMETVYRDASGRKIDTKAEKAAAARQRRLQEEKEAQKMEWGKGLVQREEEEQNRQQLERERTRDVARCVVLVQATRDAFSCHLGIDMQMMLSSIRPKRIKPDGMILLQPSFL